MDTRAEAATDTDVVRPLVVDGAWSKAMEAVTSGVVLAGLALHLGASPLLIGLVAASPFFAQFAQFAGLRLVFFTRDRRKVSLVAAFLSRLLLGGVGFVALVGPSPWALPILLVLLAASGCLSAMSAVSWAFWMRDLIPQHVYGQQLSRRFAVQAAVSVIVTLAAGAALSYAAIMGAPGVGFAALFFTGTAFGLVSLLFAARLPDVPLNPADAAPSVGELVRAVAVGDSNRDMALFLVVWTGAAFLGVPFVTVFLLREVGLGFAIVSALAALAMMAGLATFRFWGRSVDRFGARAVLALALPAAAIAMFCLPVAAGTAPLRLALLAVVFVLSGAAFAAVDVALAKLVARRAPFTGAGTFLAGAGIVRALAAGIATVLGGVLANALVSRSLHVEVSWGAWSSIGDVSGYAFLFLASALLMLYAWHRVLGLREDTRGDVRDVLHEAQVELTGLAPFRGVRIVGQFAGHVASHVVETRHRFLLPHHGKALGPSARKRISR